MNENFKVYIKDNIQKSSGSSLSEFYEKLRIAINSKNEQSIYQLSKIITRFYFKELKY